MGQAVQRVCPSGDEAAGTCSIQEAHSEGQRLVISVTVPGTEVSFASSVRNSRAEPSKASISWLVRDTRPVRLAGDAAGPVQPRPTIHVFLVKNCDWDRNNHAFSGAHKVPVFTKNSQGADADHLMGC